MKVICAWCAATIHDGSLPASHGIWPSCSARVLAGEK